MKPSFTRQLPGRTVTTTDGASYLWFSGTDYLGMGVDEDFRKHLTEGIQHYGTHFGSSRNGSLQLEIYQEAERSLAAFAGYPAALLVSSGMWAGQLVMKEIRKIMKNVNATADTQYHYAPGAHPAIWNGEVDLPLGSWKDWAENLVSEINQADINTVRIICTDAVGSPFVQSFDFSVFEKIEKVENVWLVVDESHAIGVIGKDGRGIFEQIPEKVRAQTIMLGSLNKGMGIPAGFIGAAPDILAQLRQSPWFAGASPPAPAYTYAFRELLIHEVYRKAYRQLQDNVDYFVRNTKSLENFASAPNYPVFCSRDPALFAYLLENGIMGTSFSYPRATDPAITRLVINALHQKEDLDRLAEVYENFRF